tara:strand:- start:106 stop:276 length:171 start_codon:yes stop_codon:yes gene_type:complete
MCASPFEGTLFADSRETQQGAKEFAKNVYDVTLLFHELVENNTSSVQHSLTDFIEQ